MLLRPLHPFVILLCLAGGALAQTPPPDRVGRVAAVTGPVSFHLADAAEWQVARVNLPLTTGTGLWVGASGEAVAGLSGNRMVLAPQTEWEITRLDDQAFEATQGQGESYLHLRTVGPGDTYVVQTPRGIVTMGSAGRYGVVSGDTVHPTVVVVLDGAATLTGGPATEEIGAGQMLTVTGDGAAVPFAATQGRAVPDAFLQHALAEEAPARPMPAAAPAIVARMTGAEALADVGEWSEVPDYGPVWYPPVATYVPYRQGRWAYVAPWGWTWLDDAPWAFAPTHYGRWAQFGGRWGWVPGRDWGQDRLPVYAPALVAFFGAAGPGRGPGRGPLVGWAPLGPRDAYRPPYPVGERTVQILNQPTGANIQITNAPVFNNFVNRTALTVVPARTMTASAPVGTPLPPGAFRPGDAQFRPAVAPTRATIGATRAVLQQVNPAGLSALATHVGPGPALPRPGAPPINRVAAPVEPAARSAVPAGLPPLRDQRGLSGLERPALPGTPIRPAEPPRAEPPRVEPLRAEPPRAEPPRAEPPRAEPSRVEPLRAEPPRAEPPRVEPPRVEPLRAEPPRAEPPRAEPPRAEPPSRAVAPPARIERPASPVAPERAEPRREPGVAPARPRPAPAPHAPTAPPLPQAMRPPPPHFVQPMRPPPANHPSPAAPPAPQGHPPPHEGGHERRER